MDGLVPLSDEILRLPMVTGIISISIGWVFAYSSMAKAASFSGLVTAIQEFHFVPGKLAKTAAAAIILTEFAIAMSHLSGLAVQWVMPATVLLLIAFLVGTAVVLRRGLPRACLCFGANSSDQIDIYSLVRISLLLIMEAALYLHHLSGGASHTLTSGRPYEELLLMTLVGAVVVSILGWVLAVQKLSRVWRAIAL